MDNIEARSATTCEVCESKECPICGKRHCKIIHNACDSIKNAEALKETANVSLDSLRNAKDYDEEVVPFDEFMELIKSNPDNENSMSVAYYGDLKKYVASEPKEGDSPYQVEIEVTPSTLSSIHSHPNNTPPSGSDVINTAKWYSEHGIYRNTYIYTANEIYLLYVEDTAKVKAFYTANANKASAPGSSSMFVANSNLDQYWDTAYEKLRELADTERHMMALAEVLRKSNSGIQILRWTHNGSITSTPNMGIYTTSSYNNDKIITPLKCE